MQNSKNFAIASLICGILSIVLPWIPYGYIFAIAAGIVAIVLSVKRFVSLTMLTKVWQPAVL